MSTHLTRPEPRIDRMIGETANRSRVPASITESIDAAIFGLDPSELAIVLRFVNSWERCCWMTRQEAVEWRRRISAQQGFVRLFPDPTFVLRSGRPEIDFLAVEDGSRGGMPSQGSTVSLWRWPSL